MIFTHIFILLITHTNAIALPASWQHHCLAGNYTANCTYHANLNHLMSILPSQYGNGYGFSVSRTAIPPTKFTQSGCAEETLNPTFAAIASTTPHSFSQKEAIGWYDYCLLCYSNRSMFGIKQISLKACLINPNTASSNFKDEFFQDLRTLLDGLKNRAASSGSLLKFATANMSAPEFRTIYALVQCRPDLSPKDCNNCLYDALADIPGCFYWRIGGRVIGTNCHLRNESGLFYNQTNDVLLASSAPPLALTAPPPSTNKTTTTGGKESNTSRTTVIIGVVSSTIEALVLIISICVFIEIRRAKQKDEMGYIAPEYATHGESSVTTDVFSFSVLLLEIVSGQKKKKQFFRHGEHVEGILSYAWRTWRDNTALNILDPLIRVNSGSEIMRCIHIALLCVQENVVRRPTMNTVVLMLNSYSLPHQVPSEPAFFMHSSIVSDMPLAIESDLSNSLSVHASATAASITEHYPR